MAQKKPEKKPEKDKKRGETSRFTAAAVTLAILAAFFLFLNENYFRIDGIPTLNQIAGIFGLDNSAPATIADGEIAVHFIDVGQGDCEFIETSGKTALIDCGEDEYSSSVISYIESTGTKRLDYVIVSHPHSDHMGGMSEILGGFEIGMVIMPYVPENMTPTSDCYEKMLDVIENRGINAEFAEIGSKLELGNGAELEIMAPVSDEYEDLNNFSILCKLIHGENSFLFTGDIEKKAEYDILDSGVNVSADVLKAGHHGSSTSTSEKFLDAVNPAYAVIEVGKDNSYGHPSQKVVDRLKKIGCEYYCTKDYGNIVFVSDGKVLTIHTGKGD